MSVINISIPPEPDHDVNEWSENDVELFLMANMKQYRLMNQDIQAVKLQRVSGFNLLDLIFNEVYKICTICPSAMGGVDSEHSLIGFEILKQVTYMGSSG